MASRELVVERLNAALAGRYKIQRQVGEGGMAIVFLAKDLKHDRPVALKVLRPELSATIGAERFLREIQISARLNHPHILTLIDSGEADSLLYYVMPFVEGESLRERMEREGQLPLDETFNIVREVADGLGYAHRLNIVHRDIKPENVLLSEGHAIVTDFGIAKAVTVAGGRITKTGGSVGSPLYMSPEQTAGRESLDGRSDLYSLACMLFEMLAGEPPFTGQSVQALIAKHAMEPPPDVGVLRASVPEQVRITIKKALAKAPADRFKTVADFAAVLSTTSAIGEAGASDRAEPAPPGRKVITPSSITVRWGRGWSVPLVGVALVGLTALGVFIGTRSAGEGQPEVQHLWEPGTPVTRRQITFSGAAGRGVLSPNGSYVAFWERHPDSLFLMPVNGGARTLLTVCGWCGDAPEWTPDGTEVLFANLTGEVEARGIYAIPITGGPARWVASGAPPIALSPDGEHLVRIGPLLWPLTRTEPPILVFSRLDDPISYDTVAIYDSGQKVVDIEWSPNGEEFLVSVSGGFEGPRYFTEIRASDGTLRDTVAVRDYVSWTPDSRSILFQAWDGGLGILSRATLEAAGKVGGAVDQFSGIPLGGISLSSDGQRLAYVRQAERETATVMVAEILEGGQLGRPRLVSPRTGIAEWPTFSPDEQEIALRLGERGHQDIWVFPLGGGDPTQITRLNQDFSNLVWSGDGSTIGFTTSDSMRVVKLMTIPAEGGQPETFATIDEGGAEVSNYMGEAESSSLLISQSGDSLLYWDFVTNDPDSILLNWTDGQHKSAVPISRRERGVMGPNGEVYLSFTPEGATILSLKDGSTVRSIPINWDPYPRWSSPEPFPPIVLTEDGWIYFGVWVTHGETLDDYLEIWRVHLDGGVITPAVFETDGTPKRFEVGHTYLSPQAKYVAWVVNEQEADLWIAEVSPEGGSTP